jgi:hypothetical protein
MRSPIYFLCAMAFSLAKGQDVLPILYYVPPTMGCNGVVAVALPVWNGCIGQGGAWMMTPMGCASDAWWASADTAFIPICSDPCEFVIADDFGNACMCSVGSPTSIDARSDRPTWGAYRTNDVIVITSDNVLEGPMCRVYNVYGQLIMERQFSSGSRWEIAMPWTDQVLFIALYTKDRTVVRRI